MTDAAATVRAAYLRHKDALVGHLYRLTGEAADAEDLAQETFRRTLEKPPPDLSRDLGGYLFRVATRLGIDHLRRARRRRAARLRLPEPWPNPPAPPLRPEAETRYEIRQTASIAFLHALDVLTPLQRATLLLRDVCGFSTREAASILGVTEGAAKQHLRRARKVLAHHHLEEGRFAEARRTKARRLFDRAMACLLSGDTAGFAALLSEDVTARADAGGRYAAAASPLVGRAKVAALYGGLVRLFGRPKRAIPLWVGHDPAVLLDLDPPSPAFAPRALVCARLGAEGRFDGIFTILDPDRLTRCGART
ncbi:MAG: sigma-70 family RNA polymerase sigma factor [Deltaproteobacteria bacterium]|nr:MAG: sigma-70 family RNA polymerase sigma factor [Deltaproteobacteria bacterium]